MLFNSLSFFAFFPTIVILYWILPIKIRRLYLIIASLYFYANWEPKFTLILLFSIAISYLSGILINRFKENCRRRIVTISIVILLLPLIFYKYLNFLDRGINTILEMLNFKMEIPHFSLLLPIGISFFTFMAIGYVIDVYRGKIREESNLLTYTLFIAFFPQIAAGPIGRADKLIPQFRNLKAFNSNKFIEGLKMMVWGYFMKLCIAERVAPYVDAVFGNLQHHNGTTMLLAAFFYTFQILGDFGGYSLIAIGVAKCLNIDLMENFHRPYLSVSMRDFWKRWHISLSSWFMEYIYFPLGGSRCRLRRNLINLVITMSISGLWHGANWTFICWGFYHGLLLCFLVLKKKIVPQYKIMKSKIIIAVDILISFIAAMTGWIFFKAATISDAIYMIKKICTSSGHLFNGDGMPNQLLGIMCIALLMMKDIKDEYDYKWNFMHNNNIYISTLSIALMISLIILTGVFEGGQFIYFKF